jgi:hypothetical protein
MPMWLNEPGWVRSFANGRRLAVLERVYHDPERPRQAAAALVASLTAGR